MNLIAVEKPPLVTPMDRNVLPPRARNPVLKGLGRVADVSLATIPQLDECKPGLRPVEYNVIIAPAVLSELTQGGILLADLTREREGDAMQIGRLISISPLAFNFDRWPADAERPPKPGDLIWYAKFAGAPLEGADGREYRMCKDKDICAVIEP